MVRGAEWLSRAQRDAAMSAKPLSRILLTNDDGIDSEGLGVAAEVASRFAEEIWIVAPQRDQTAASHALSFHQPVRVIEHAPRKFAVIGTPGDCVVMAVRSIMADNLPDLVISGVNAGANLADDITYSGTVSGAMTAVLCGIPAIAMCQAYRSNARISWDTARKYGVRVLERVLSAPLPNDLCLNVNFPAVAPGSVTGIRATRQGRRSIRSIDLDERRDLRNRPYYWLSFSRTGGEQDPDSDIAALRGKAVSVTPLRFDRTDDAVLPQLSARLDPT